MINKTQMVVVMFVLFIISTVASASDDEQVDLVISKKPNPRYGLAITSSNNESEKRYEKRSVDKSNIEAEMTRLRMQKDVVAVERDYPVTTHKPVKSEKAYTPGLVTQTTDNESPNDPQFNNQFAWKDRTSTYKGQSNIEKAFLKSEKNNIVNVAVIDVGFRDTTDMSWNGGYNFVDEPSKNITKGSEFRFSDDPNCNSTHAQSVGQIIGATTNNGYGMAGIADVNMYGVRVLKCNSEGRLSDMADGIRWTANSSTVASENIGIGIDVINISVGGKTGSCPSYMQDAINFANNKGIVIVVSAGNTSEDVSNISPANCNNVITVASVDRSGKQSSFTNYGSEIDVAMLGENVLSAGFSSGNFRFWSGTSFSAPLTTGIIAMGELLKNDLIKKDLTPLDIENFIKQSTNSFESSTNSIGTGIVDAHQYHNLIQDQERDDNQPKDIDLKHGLSTQRRCDDSLYINDSSLNACEVYEVIVNESFKEESQFYVIFEVDSGKEMTVSNGNVKGASRGERFAMQSIDAAKNYGIQVCSGKNGDSCKSSSLIDLEIDNVSVPNSCKE